MSDYLPFWEAEIPFLFLTAGRSRIYHTPEDTPDKLDWNKIAATERWLARFVRATRTRDRIAFDRNGAGDLATLDSLDAILGKIGRFSMPALFARRRVAQLRGSCDRNGRLSSAKRTKLAMLVGALESRLA